MSNYFLIYYVNQTKIAYALINMGNIASRKYYLSMREVFKNLFFILNLKVRAFVYSFI